MNNKALDSTYVPLYLQGKYNNDNNRIENKPESEQKCFAFQTKWLKTRDPKVWEEWVALVYNYTRSLILKKLEDKKFLEPDEVDSATADATFSFMAQYLKPTKEGKQFEVGASFAGMIGFKVLEALYRPKLTDKKELSFNMLKAEDDHRDISDTLKELQYTDSESDYVRYKMSDLVADAYHEIDCMFGSAYDRCTAKIFTNILLMGPKSSASKSKFLSKWATYELQDKLPSVIDVIKECATNIA